MNRILLLFSNCLLVKGYSRAAICDLQRRNLHLIPNSFADLFKGGRYIEWDKLVESVKGTGLYPILLEYEHLLISNELAFFSQTSELCHYPEIDNSYYFPAHISNCIIDSHVLPGYLSINLLNQLSALGCRLLLLRLFSSVSTEQLSDIAGLVNNAQLPAFELMLPKPADDGFYDHILAMVENNRKIHSVIIHSDSEDRIIKKATDNNPGVILTTRTAINSSLHCGVTDPQYFSVNLLHYTEAFLHNSCLNRKISIDTEGNIRNCPSMKESFGNIRDTTLAEALRKPGFKQYWNITKDQIRVCMDCEFRYVCTDCRAYLEDPADMFSKPLKCGYDPYTCEWEEWSTHPMKQQAIVHYGLRDLSNNKEQTYGSIW